VLGFQKEKPAASSEATGLDCLDAENKFSMTHGTHATHKEHAMHATSPDPSLVRRGEGIYSTFTFFPTFSAFAVLVERGV